MFWNQAGSWNIIAAMLYEDERLKTHDDDISPPVSNGHDIADIEVQSGN